MNLLEVNNVKNIYEKISKHFDLTRENRIWTNVETFLLNHITNDKLLKILDYGCGNGKYIPLVDLNLHEYYAYDNCANFIELINSRYPLVKTNIGNVNQNNYSDNYFDLTISIAVIHHLSTLENRVKMINEILRTLKIGGKCLITAWTSDKDFNIPTKSIKDNKLFKKATAINDDNDYLIPWLDLESKEQFNRYYHLFSYNEFNELLKLIDYPIIVEDYYYEMNNYCIIISKASIRTSILQ